MADWSNLPYDILHLITSKLELPDYHRMSAVCKNWRCATKQAICHPTHNQLPWLVLGEDKSTKKRVFFSLSENKHYHIDIPELYGHMCRGSSYGWLLTVDENTNSHVLNPFTRECYHLPPFPHLERNVAAIEAFPPKEWQQRVVTKALLSNNPSEGRGFTVAALYSVMPVVILWRHGDPDHWTVLESPHGLIRDIAFFNGKLYALHASLVVTIVDLTCADHPKMTVIEPWVDQYVDQYGLSDDSYLVNFEEEFLLLIQRNMNEVERDHYITKDFFVSELNLEEETEYLWEDLGGSVIFVASTSSMVVDLDDELFSGCRPDSIYFTAIDIVNYSDERFGLDDHGFYDIVNKTVEIYYSPEIFLPLHTSPVWFTPNPM